MRLKMQTTLSIAKIEDVDALIALGQATYRAHYASLWSPAGLEAYINPQFAWDHVHQEIIGEKSTYWLAWVEGMLVGYAKLNHDKLLPVEGYPPGLELEKIYFMPEATGYGLGTRMITHIIAEARKQGLSGVWLDVLQSNVRGRQMYERSGFRLIGELPFETDLHRINFWVMYHDLG
jgi:diamine N-acetyltransferase